MLGEFFGLMEAPGIVAEGLLNGKSIVVCNVEGEVAGFAIEGWIAGDSETFGVIEDDDGILISDARIEPGKRLRVSFISVGLTVWKMVSEAVTSPCSWLLISLTSASRLMTKAVKNGLPCVVTISA